MINSNSQGDRQGRIEALLERSIVASDEQMTRIEQKLQDSVEASNERMTRIEQSVESNNRFLESFSQDLRTYTDSMNNLANRLDGVIAASNYNKTRQTHD
jgi:phage-related tail protein